MVVYDIMGGGWDVVVVVCQCFKESLSLHRQILGKG
jgi:hypothetical protein